MLENNCRLHRSLLLLLLLLFVVHPVVSQGNSAKAKCEANKGSGNCVKCNGICTVQNQDDSIWCPDNLSECKVTCAGSNEPCKNSKIFSGESHLIVVCDNQLSSCENAQVFCEKDCLVELKGADPKVDQFKLFCSEEPSSYFCAVIGSRGKGGIYALPTYSTQGVITYQFQSQGQDPTLKQVNGYEKTEGSFEKVIWSQKRRTDQSNLWYDRWCPTQSGQCGWGNACPTGKKNKPCKNSGATDCWDYHYGTTCPHGTIACTVPNACTTCFKLKDGCHLASGAHHTESECAKGHDTNSDIHVWCGSRPFQITCSAGRFKNGNFCVDCEAGQYQTSGSFVGNSCVSCFSFVFFYFYF